MAEVGSHREIKTNGVKERDVERKKRALVVSYINQVRGYRADFCSQANYSTELAANLVFFSLSNYFCWTYFSE